MNLKNGQTMGTKQTALDWFEEKIVNTQMISKWMYDYLQEAKAMEKNQIKDAFLLSDTSNASDEDAEQYYNETYNKKDNDN